MIIFVLKDEKIKIAQIMLLLCINQVQNKVFCSISDQSNKFLGNSISYGVSY